MGKKWNYLFKLINEEKKTIVSLGRLTPKLRWRILELDTELIKLVKERENKEFLTNRKKGVKKSYYFRESRKLNSQIVRQGRKLLKIWPNIPYASDIYYTLALNSRDYGKGKKTEYYLLKSLSKLRGNAELKHKVQTSLAEHYYNNKKYRKAIKFYSRIIKVESDEWLTKHHYNLAWCYVKLTKYSKGIDHALKSHELSTLEEKRYVSVKSQILNSIGLFYTLDNRIKEGVDFYINNSEKPAEYLLKMASKTATDGKFDLAKYIYDKALDFSIDKKQNDEQEKIYLSSFEFYRNFKRNALFYKTAKAVEKMYLEKRITKEGIEESKDKIKSLVGYLQVKFTRNSQARLANHDPVKRDEIISYFDILITIDKIQEIEYLYYQGETYFAVNMFDSAYNKYLSAINIYKKNPKIKIVNQKKKLPFFHRSLNSMLASIEYGEFKKKKLEERKIETYYTYTHLLPKDEKSPVLNQKLFNLYLKNSDIANAEQTLDYYTKTHPKDNKTHRQMYTTIFDHFIKNKNSKQLAIRINKISKGYLSFPKAFIQQSTKVLGQILFSNYEKVTDNEAITGYVELFNNPLYPKEIKSNSALKLGVLYNNENNISESVNWYLIGLKLAKEAVIKKNEEKLKTLAIQYNHKLNFEESNKLIEFYLSKYCTSKFKSKNLLFQLYVSNHLLSDELKSAVKASRKYKKCKIGNKNIANTNIEISNYIKIKENINKFISFHQSIYPQHKEIFTSHLEEVFWMSFAKGNKSNQRAIAKILKKYKVKDFPYQLITKFETWSKSLPQFKGLNQKAKFNEAIFNKNLEYNLKRLEEFEKNSNSIVNAAHPEITPLIYKSLEAQYKNLISMIRGVYPKAVPQDYVKGFRGAMAGLAKNLEKKIHKVTTKTIRLYERNKVVSNTFSSFNSQVDLTQQINYQHKANSYTIANDKGGF